jgi:hypothetical protein
MAMRTIVILCVLGLLVAPAFAARQESITQYGITWTFSEPREVGQFVNGDWWVVGPVTITAITPAPGPVDRDDTAVRRNQFGDAAIRPDVRMRNGSMIVTEPSGRQGYDSRLRNYEPNLSVSLPLELPVNRSLISTISRDNPEAEYIVHQIMWPSEKKARVVLRTAAVLTCLPEAPAADAFRPPYAGPEKPIYRASNLQWDRLARLPMPEYDNSQWTEGVYTLELPKDWPVVERWFERPWLDHMPSWMTQRMSPSDNMPCYGREWVRAIGIASLLLHTDVPDEKKRTLLVRLVQLGIDVDGLVDMGRGWMADGGHWSGRKWPRLFAGIMLDEPTLRDMPEGINFQEDQQTYYGTGWAGQDVLWQMVTHHGPRRPFEERPPEQWDSMDRRSQGYRLCCTGRAWVGQALAIRLMQAIPLWQHDAFLDYEDRWMAETDPYAANRGEHDRPDQEGESFDPFVNAMWHAYRDQAPEQPRAGSPRKWVWEGRHGKWVPNPRPTAEQVSAHVDAIRQARQEVERQEAADREAQDRRAREKFGDQVDAQLAAARAANVPEGTFVLVQAESVARQGGGKVRVTDKPDAFGKAIMHWDDKGHWLEYDVEIPHDGYYQVVLRYAWGEGGGPGLRSLKIDGESPTEYAERIELARTGGWAAWRFHRLGWPEFHDQPFLVKLARGPHRLRLENLGGGGVNLDYIVLAEPAMALTRDAVENQ